MDSFSSLSNPSWVTQLVKDPTEENFRPNQTPRQVKSGHFVPVTPTKLPNPRLIIHSSDVARMVGLDEDACLSETFCKFFSGDVDVLPAFKSWCTGYALSIYGSEMTEQCPFRTGNAYGDGRAISIGEVLVPTTAAQGSNERFELQLKGAGRTPYCRGADGRAVLRSSIREFLASEANHQLGVSTTRALSLICSASERTVREWQGKVTKETCAITCRVAPSFTRVGHIELHARRTRDSSDVTANSSRAAISREQAVDELRMIVEHAMFREYGGKPPYPAGTPLKECGGDLQKRVLDMMRVAAKRFAVLAANWLRVGFCQGNFNSDNTLIAGRTMDYGPFGFMEKYKPDWSSWVGGGMHFSFKNQPNAASVNFQVFAASVAPLLDANGRTQLMEIIQLQLRYSTEEVQNVYKQKLGLFHWTSSCDALLQRLESLMEKLDADYTMFWRELAKIPAIALPIALCEGSAEISTEEAFMAQLKASAADLLEPLTNADMFFKTLSTGHQSILQEWVVDWLVILRAQLLAATTAAGPSQLDSASPLLISGASVTESMKQVSPKYVLREWMLEEAYRAAQDAGDMSFVHTLHRLIQAPYEEQPEFEKKFYKRSSDSGVTKIT